MPIFKKKNPVKKVEVKHDPESFKTHEIKIKIAPLVRIEQHESRINGKVQAPKYRISVADRDVIELSAREYNELFMEMLRHKDSHEIIHCISEAHIAEYHSDEPKEGDIKDLFDTLEKMAKHAHEE